MKVIVFKMKNTSDENGQIRHCRINQKTLFSNRTYKKKGWKEKEKTENEANTHRKAKLRNRKKNVCRPWSSYSWSWPLDFSITWANYLDQIWVRFGHSQKYTPSILKGSCEHLWGNWLVYSVTVHRDCWQMLVYYKNSHSLGYNDIPSLKLESICRTADTVAVFSIWKEERTMAHLRRISRVPSYTGLYRRGWLKRLRLMVIPK